MHNQFLQRPHKVRIFKNFPTVDSLTELKMAGRGNCNANLCIIMFKSLRGGEWNTFHLTRIHCLWWQNSIVLIDCEVFVFAMKVHRVPSIPVVASALFALVGGLTTLWTIVFLWSLIFLWKRAYIQLKQDPISLWWYISSSSTLYAEVVRFTISVSLKHINFFAQNSSFNL